MIEGQGRCKLDSHADTALAGSNMIFLDNLSQAEKIDVYGFSDKLSPIRTLAGYKKMATLTSKQRKAAAITAGNLLPYEGLVAPYPVWAAVFACKIERALDEYKDVATCLFQDDYETCIDLNDTVLYNYHKTKSAQTVASGNQIILSVPQRNNIRAFVQWTKDATRTGQDPAMMNFKPTGIARILRKAETHKLYVANSDTHAV